MKLEEKYIQQLSDLGIYQPAFDPEIKTLCQLERELRRVDKAWHATAAPKQAPSVLDPHYRILCDLRKEILAHRDALGLTPKGLRRLQPKVPDADTAALPNQPSSPALAAILDGLKAKAGGTHV